MGVRVTDRRTRPPAGLRARASSASTRAPSPSSPPRTCASSTAPSASEHELLAARPGAPSATEMGHVPVAGRGGSLRLLAGLPGRSYYVHLNNTNPLLDAGSKESEAVAPRRRRGRDGRDGARAVTRAEFEARLRARPRRALPRPHPFNLRMHAGTLAPEEIRTWVRNRYYYQTRIPIKDGIILAKSEDPAFRRQWIRRIHDHDGDGAREGGLELWLRLAEAVGLDRARGRLAARRAARRAARLRRLRALRLRPRSAGVGGVVAHRARRRRPDGRAHRLLREALPVGEDGRACATSAAAPSRRRATPRRASRYVLEQRARATRTRSAAPRALRAQVRDPLEPARRRRVGRAAAPPRRGRAAARRRRRGPARGARRARGAAERDRPRDPRARRRRRAASATSRRALRARHREPPELEREAYAFLEEMQKLGVLEARAVSAPRPWNLIAELTYRCPLRCPYCSNPTELAAHPDGLDAAAWARAFREARALGVVHVGPHRRRADAAARPARDRARRGGGRAPRAPRDGGRADRRRRASRELARAGLGSVQLSVQDAEAAALRSHRGRAGVREEARLRARGARARAAAHAERRAAPPQPRARRRARRARPRARRAAPRAREHAVPRLGAAQPRRAAADARAAPRGGAPRVEARARAGRRASRSSSCWPTTSPSARSRAWAAGAARRWWSRPTAACCRATAPRSSPSSSGRCASAACASAGRTRPA